MEHSDKIISNISSKKRGSCCVVSFEDNDYLECSTDLVIKFKLHKGQVLSADLFEVLKSEQRKFDVKKAALSFVSYKSRTVRQVREKLKLKMFSDVEIDFAVDFLRDFKLLDDFQFAVSFVKDYLNRKAAAAPKLVAELRRRGISRDLAEEAVDGCFPHGKEFELALQAASKKLRSVKNKPAYKQEKSLVSHLQRLGFNWEIIKKVMEDISIID